MRPQAPTRGEDDARELAPCAGGEANRRRVAAGAKDAIRGEPDGRRRGMTCKMSPWRRVSALHSLPSGTRGASTDQARQHKADAPIASPTSVGMTPPFRVASLRG